MATPKKTNKVNYSLPQYLSARQARARHAQIARNYFSQKPSISNLYRGTVNWLRSIGVGSPEGTYDSYATAPAAGIGNVGAAGRVAATTRTASKGKTAVSKATTLASKRGKATPKATPTSRKTYGKPKTEQSSLHVNMDGNRRTLSTARTTRSTTPPRGNTAKPRQTYQRPHTKDRGDFTKPGEYWGSESADWLKRRATRRAAAVRRAFAPGEEGADVLTTAAGTTAGTLAALAGTAVSYGLNSLAIRDKQRAAEEKSKRQQIREQQEKEQQRRLDSINKANKARREKYNKAVVARKAQQEAAQVVATSGGAPIAPKSPRSSGGRTNSGRTAPRKRKYLDSTPAVSRTRRQRAVTLATPRMTREEVAYNNLSASQRAILESSPLVASNYDVTSAARELVDNENYDALRRLRQQYKRGGKVRC